MPDYWMVGWCWLIKAVEKIPAWDRPASRVFKSQENNDKLPIFIVKTKFCWCNICELCGKKMLFAARRLIMKNGSGWLVSALLWLACMWFIMKWREARTAVGCIVIGVLSMDWCCLVWATGVNKRVRFHSLLVVNFLTSSHRFQDSFPFKTNKTKNRISKNFIEQHVFFRRYLCGVQMISISFHQKVKTES